jgi:integrase
MLVVNRDWLSAYSRTTIAAFVDGAFLPWAREERRASTSHGYQAIWRTYLRDRVGNIGLREFRTVDANRTLAAIARERDLSRNTLRRIKSVLSTIFIYAKNVGAFDGANPVTGAFIPKNARDPQETRAYDLAQVAQMLEVLPLLAKALVATAAFAGLRHGELRGLHWTDYTGNRLSIRRSMWNSVVNPPKTRASCNAVPVIGQLAEILEEYRKSVGSSESRMLFQGGGGLPINLDAYSRRVVLPALKKIGIPWYGWHAFRRGLASNLYALGAQDKIVQRILRHSRPHVTRDCYIKVFDHTVLQAMQKLEAALERADRNLYQLRFEFAQT